MRISIHTLMSFFAGFAIGLNTFVGFLSTEDIFERLHHIGTTTATSVSVLYRSLDNQESFVFAWNKTTHSTTQWTSPFSKNGSEPLTIELLQLY